MRCLVFAVVFMAVLGCGRDNGPANTKDAPVVPLGSSITNGWKEFSFTSYGFKASFPWGMAIERPFLPGAGGRLPALAGSNDFSATLWDGNKPTYGFSIIALRFRPRSAAKDRHEAFQAALAEVSINKSLKRSELKGVSWGKQAAQEFTAEPSDPSGATDRVTVRSLATESGAYIGIVHDAGQLTPKEVTLFFDSFQLLSPPGK